MFGNAKPVVFDPYGRRGRRWRVPAWLAWLAVGLAGGIAGVLYVQNQVLPPRLSASETAKLQSDWQTAEAERRRLAGELATTTTSLQTLRKEYEALQAQADADRQRLEARRDDLAFLVETLPPDPRNGRIAVRAAAFSADRGTLSYEVALSRAGGSAADKPMAGVMQLIVSGQTVSGESRDVSLQPVSLTMGSHEVLRGKVPLPGGFTARQTTVRLLDGDARQQLGMRVLPVK